MAEHARDLAFRDFVTSCRPLLVGAALLMYGRADRAETVVQAVLAGMYRDWPVTCDAPEVALQRVVRADVGRLKTPWQPRDQFELVDAAADRPLLPPGIITDVAALDDQPRRVLVLERWAGLPRARIASLLGLSGPAVEALAGEATAQLTTSDPARQTAGVLDHQLGSAATTPVSPVDPTPDLAHGRSLLRRRRGRRLLVAAAVVLVAVLGLTQVGPRQQPNHNEPRGPVPGPARLTGGCAPADTDCRAAVLRDWRTRMAAITTAYLNPEGGYFAGYTYSADDALYETPGYWTGSGGALGFDMFKLGSGSTNVYVQIATSDRYAIACGATTHRPCVSRRSAAGTFRLTRTTRADDGLEVQYRPDNATVITVVATSVTGGLTLEVTRDQLQRLVVDDRLRLPTT